MHRPPVSLSRFAAVTLVLGSVACACPKVQLPSSDSTPPILTWKVTNKATNAVQYFTGNATIPASLGQQYEVKLTASDTGGVHEASLSGSSSWQCVSGQVASNKGPTLGAVETEKHDVWPSGEVCSEIEQFQDVGLSFDCQAGYQFNGGSVTLTGTGKNFYGGVTTATLTFNVPP